MEQLLRSRSSGLEIETGYRKPTIIPKEAISFVDLIKPLQIAYNKKHAGIPLTDEEQEFFDLIEKINK